MQTTHTAKKAYIMAKKQLPDPLEIQRAEAAGFIFSEDKKILLNCTNKDITANHISTAI